MSPDGTFTYVSPNWKSLLGHDYDFVKDKSLLEFAHPDDRNNLQSVLNRLIDEKNINDIEYRVKNFNDEWKWHSTSLTAQFNSGGEIDSIVGIAHDISERKFAENAVIESQRLSAIGEMASAVAHHFNNSLQIIFSNLEVALLDKSISRQLKNYLETIKTATSDASARVQIVQRFSGKKHIATRYSRVKLNKVVSDVIVQSRPLWKDKQEEKRIEILIDKNIRDIPDVMGNDGELRSVIYNLIKNSIEAMPEGGTIYFETGTSDTGVFIRITDTGIGMTDDVNSRVFQPFFTTKGFEIGRGLGMSGAYSIIKEHNGDLKILRSAPCKGTTIEVLIPFSNFSEENNEQENVKEFEGAANILWVDDKPMIQEIASELIEALGHKCKMVSGGMEALEILEVESFDLIITDIGMPRMSGWQLADKINEKFNGKMKVAALTVWSNQFDDDEGISHNVDFILTKPIKINELKSLIDKAMQLQK